MDISRQQGVASSRFAVLILLSTLPLRAFGSPTKGSVAPGSKTSSSEHARTSPKPVKEITPPLSRYAIEGFLSYETLKPSREESASLSGFGGAAVGIYLLDLSPKLYMPLGGGLHYTSISGSASGVSFAVTLTSIILEAGLMSRFSPSLDLGGFFSYDYGMSGSESVNIPDIGSQSLTISASSRMNFGILGLAKISSRMKCGGMLSLTSGSATESGTGPDGSSTATDSLSGMMLGGVILYSL